MLFSALYVTVAFAATFPYNDENGIGGVIMQYRTNPRNGDALSALGFGCMRFTRRGGGIDQEKADREMGLARALGGD